MELKSYFLNPSNGLQKQYEALRAFYAEGLSASDAAERFHLSPFYFKKLRYEFSQAIRKGDNPFFQTRKRGPKERFTEATIIEEIITLRKQNFSIQDIKSIFEAKDRHISLDTINNILRAEGFAPLPKRTRQERLSVKIPKKIEPPQCATIDIRNEEFSTEKNAGVLIFLPLIEQLGIIEAIKKAKFPKTSVISDISSILSFVALKILGNERLSHDTGWNMDRSLGLFAGLNVLPKSSTLSTYSYRVQRSSNRRFLIELNRIFKDTDMEEGVFNLDFKAIPHWGDKSILEKNWSGARSKAIKSILSLIVEDPSTGYLSYTDAEIRHQSQDKAVLDFVDFWKEGRGMAPKMLIFDSKFTTYKNLNKLNESRENIKFLTLRRRGKKLVNKALEIPEKEWQNVRVEGAGRKSQIIRVHDGYCKLRNYKGEVRQIILTNHGRKQPSFLITNDFNIGLKDLIKKYARRWLVEQEIAEQIVFFHLNNPSSSIVVKVDFDLTISLLTHNLYRILAKNLIGFERCTVPTIYRKFLENGANIKIQGNEVLVYLKKKTHLPILFELPWMKDKNPISWLNLDISFQADTIS